MSRLHMIAGVVFDLDGTLTRPGAIDFAAIRERIGMKPRGSILHWIEENVTDPREVREMHAAIREEEDRGLERMELGDGFPALVAALEGRGGNLATGICTRNSGAALAAFDRLVASEGFPPASELFAVQIARDHVSPTLGRTIENKPSCEPAHEFVRRWGLEEHFPITVAHEAHDPVFPELLFVGDDIDDCLCGRRAGWEAALLLNGSGRGQAEHVAARVSHQGLADVAEVLLATGVPRERPRR